MVRGERQEHVCPRCGYITIEIGAFKRHLQRRTLCDPLVLDCDLQDFKDQYLVRHDKPFQCEDCQKAYQTKTGLHFHRKKEHPPNESIAHICKEMEELKGMLGKIESQLVSQSSQHHPIVTPPVQTHQTTNQTHCQNNTIIQNNTIHVNAFSCEEISHILEDKAFMDTVLRRREKGLLELIKAIYFDRENHPENNTVRVTNYRNGLIDTFNGKRWMKCDKSDVLEDMLDTSCSHIDEHYEDVKDVLINKFSRTFIELIREFMNRVKDRDQHTKFFEELKRRIHLLIVNESGILDS